MAQKGPGNFARGWTYNLYTATTTIYREKSKTDNASILGYEKLSMTILKAIDAIERDTFD